MAMRVAHPGHNEVGWNTSFSQEYPLLQLAWDSVSLGLLKECPRKYWLTIIMGYNGRTLNVHLLFGLLYHGALEHYDHSRARGEDHAAGVRAAIRYCLSESWDHERNRPLVFDDANKNRLTLVRTVVWYLEQFCPNGVDPCETVILANGKPAVELSYRYNTQVQAFTGEEFILSGHLDRLIKFQDQKYILDRKTTKNTLSMDYFAKFTPDNQFSGYCLAGQVALSEPIAGLIVDAAQVAVTFSRFQRAPVYRTTEQLSEWFTDTTMYFHMAEIYARSGHWPMNDKSCNNYGGCEFRGICGKSPLVRKKWLEASFVRTKWDPLVARGDI